MNEQAAEILHNIAQRVVVLENITFNIMISLIIIFIACGYLMFKKGK